MTTLLGFHMRLEIALLTECFSALAFVFFLPGVNGLYVDEQVTVVGKAASTQVTAD